MKILLFLFVSLCSSFAFARVGVPFFVNYTAASYGAHNRNFDVVADTAGVVFFANFEGLLYYDHDRWRTLHTPGYSRVTRLFRDSRGQLWAAGYNFLASVQVGDNGSFRLEPLVSDTSTFRIGEIVSLYGHGRHIRLSNTEGEVYQTDGRTVVRVASASAAAPSSRILVSGIGPLEINDSLSLGGGLTALATRAHGMVFIDSRRRMVSSVSESDGLCSNHIRALASDGHGSVWGVTDNGICRVFFPSKYSGYTVAQGLRGEVTAIQSYCGALYVGTLQGLYCVAGGRVSPVSGISQACWKLQVAPDGLTLYAATTEGVFAIRTGHAVRLTDLYAQTLCCRDDGIYIAGIDALYRLSSATGKPVRMAAVRKVVSLWSDSRGDLLARDIDGSLYRMARSGSGFVPDGTSRTGSVFFPDSSGSSGWQVDADGKKLSRVFVSDSVRTDSLPACLLPLTDISVRALSARADSVLWVGGSFGLIRVGLKDADASFSHFPVVRFREVGLDSVSGSSSVFGPATREVSFRFSADAAAPLGQVVYQYQLRGYDDGWSAWTSNTYKNYANLFYGSYTFQVRARDAFGRVSQPASYSFSIAPPFYLRWYSLMIDAVLFGLFVWMVIRWRLRSLLREKEHLEELVRERTLQIQGQKEEIERKSVRLEQALSDLRHAQQDLLRQEKMATVGKLTRGLIDRMLNPLNYINNFSHLSIGLVSDLHVLLSKLSGQMTPDDAADSTDLLELLSSNLSKIECHGTSTSRILKAMEEILKETDFPRQPTDITALCRQSVALTHEYYADEIARLGVAVKVSLPDSEVLVRGHAGQLGKTLMSLVRNAMYALARKYDRAPYAPRIFLSLTVGEGSACIRLRDNGIGIGPSVIDRIFDPFFTTKTAAEAAGVGLYLSREIIMAHGGTISVDSRPDEFTEFTLVLPLI